MFETIPGTLHIIKGTFQKVSYLEGGLSRDLVIQAETRTKLLITWIKIIAKTFFYVKLLYYICTVT